MDPWILFLDLDGTLWDQPDISGLMPPFRRISDDRIVDLDGVVVRLYKDMVELVRWARGSGAITSTLSWNDPSIALEALEAFGILELFDYIAIEPHPDKGEMASKVIERVKAERRVSIPACRIVYIDDREIHVDDVRARLGEIVFLKAWSSFKNASEAKNMIIKALSACT